MTEPMSIRVIQQLLPALLALVHVSSGRLGAVKNPALSALPKLLIAFMASWEHLTHSVHTYDVHVGVHSSHPAAEWPSALLQCVYMFSHRRDKWRRGARKGTLDGARIIFLQ